MTYVWESTVERMLRGVQNRIDEATCTGCRLRFPVVVMYAATNLVDRTSYLYCRQCKESRDPDRAYRDAQLKGI